MEKVKIVCPSCSKNGIIEISPDALKNSLRGLLAVNIAKGIICEHSFIAYIDKNLNVRDYFIADFQIELPEITPEEKIKVGKIPSKDIVDIDLIKLNMPAIQLVYILKSIFYKQKVVLINDQEFLYTHIYNFLKYITQNSFEIDISILTQEKYKNNKKNYKDSMVFKSVSIVKNVKNLINPKKIDVEKQIVNRFMTEYDLGYSYIVLKNDIQKAFELSKVILDFVDESEKKNESVNILKINVELEKKYEIKINKQYLNFLTEIVEHYFGVLLPSLTDSFFDFL
ncbi:MAG: hypothetical protein ACFFAN_07615 [Promethearchaeota archaeon]